MLPALGTARRHALRMESAARVRGIQQALFQYAQGNNQKYPGLGKDEDLTVEGRYQILLDGNFFTPDYLISPVEGQTTGSFPPFDYSYSLLKIAQEGGRRVEWSGTANSQAAVVSDRNTGLGPSARSIHSETLDWRGSVAYIDGSTNFETSNIIGLTRYGDVQNVNDDLFATTGTDDAMMIYEGE